MTATGGDVWGEGIATAGAVVHLIYGTGEVRYRRSDNEGATWTSDTRIGDGAIHLTDPVVADGNDVWIIAYRDLQTLSDWCCSRELGNLYLLRSRDGGRTWDAPLRLTTSRGVLRASIAYAAGRLHLVWMDYRTGAWDTYYLRSTDRGTSWEPEVRLAQSTGIFGAERPQIAAQGNDVHVTIWDDRGGNPPCTASITFPNCPDTFYVGSLDGGVTWGSLVNVAKAGAAFSGRNDIAVASPTSVVINFNQTVSGMAGDKMFVVRSGDRGMTWGAPVQLTTGSGGSDHGSIIGYGASVHLVWHDDRDTGNREIYYRGSTNAGVSWNPEERVSSGAAGDSSTPLNAVTPGYLHVIWIDNRGGTYQVYYSRRAAGAGGTGGSGGGTGGTGGSGGIGGASGRGGTGGMSGAGGGTGGAAGSGGASGTGGRGGTSGGAGGAGGAAGRGGSGGGGAAGRGGSGGSGAGGGAAGDAGVGDRGGGSGTSGSAGSGAASGSGGASGISGTGGAAGGGAGAGFGGAAGAGTGGAAGTAGTTGAGGRGGTAGPDASAADAAGDGPAAANGSGCACTTSGGAGERSWLAALALAIAATLSRRSRASRR